MQSVYNLIAMWSENFPALLKQTMKRMGVSQGLLAERLNSTQPYISEMANGKKRPSESMAKAIALALDAEVDDFLLAAGYAPERVQLRVTGPIVAPDTITDPPDEEELLLLRKLEDWPNPGPFNPRNPDDDYWLEPREGRLRIARNLVELWEAHKAQQKRRRSLEGV